MTMSKLIFNIALIMVLFAPCLLVFSDSIAMQCLGAFYAVEFYLNIVTPIYNKIKLQNK